MGFASDMSKSGFGEMLRDTVVDNGVVTHLNVEAPRKISDAETILGLV